MVDDRQRGVRLRSGEETQVELTGEETRALGLAPSAAATYARGQGVSIAGYGEMLYENFGNEQGAQFDFLRAIIYAGSGGPSTGSWLSQP